MQPTASTHLSSPTLFGGDEVEHQEHTGSLGGPLSTPECGSGGQSESLNQFGDVSDLSAASQDLIGRIKRVRADNIEAMTDASKWADNSWIGDHIGDLQNWNEHLAEMQEELSGKAPTWDHIHTAKTSLANVDKESERQRTRGKDRIDKIDLRYCTGSHAMSEQASVIAKQVKD